MGKTVGYKAMNMDMTCRDFQFEVGKTYHVGNDKSLNLCTDSGFHFCEDLEDVFKFYDWYNCRIFKVETSSSVVTDGEKSITKELTIVGELTRDDLKYEELASKTSKNYYNIMLEEEEDLIFRTFKDDYNFEVRLAVINRLTCEDLIIETFKEDKYIDVRIAIIDKLTDSNLILLFKDDSSRFVRSAVVYKLTDEQLIFNNFKDDSDLEVRSAVIDKLADNDLILTFKDDPDWFVRCKAVRKLTDKRLIKLFENDDNDVVRNAVRKKLGIR